MADALLKHIRRLIAHCPKSDNVMQDQLFKSFMYEQIVEAIKIFDERKDNG